MMHDANRQDPSIIVLVTNPDSTHALLARSPRHPSYLYTAIAGFVEAGEQSNISL
jgi:NADH pyrophosphatase NudC (nudix superfamily)